MPILFNLNDSFSRTIFNVLFRWLFSAQRRCRSRRQFDFPIFDRIRAYTIDEQFTRLARVIVSLKRIVIVVVVI